MRKVAVPAMGRDGRALFAALGRKLGFEIIETTSTSPRTLKLGSETAPEEKCSICFHSMLGDYIEGVMRGADCCAFIGGYGACQIWIPEEYLNPGCSYRYHYGPLLQKRCPEVDFYMAFPDNMAQVDGFMELMSGLVGRPVPRLELLKAVLPLLLKDWLREILSRFGWNG